MKLLYITNGITGAGGLERVLSVKASILAEQFGYEVHVLSLNEGAKKTFFEFSPKIIKHSIAVIGNPLQYIKAYKNGIQQKVEEIKPDIISVCDDGLKGFFVPRILGNNIPVVYERHVSRLIENGEGQNQIGHLFSSVKFRMMNRLATSFNRFVVLTEGNIKEWNLPNIAVIPNPIPFYPDSPSALQSKKVIAVGKQSFQKAYDLLLLSWSQLPCELKDWELHIYGKIDESLNLSELAEQLGIEQQVFFHDPEKNIKTRYLESSVFVLSSRFEGFGMVIIEAMACGLPVVSFDCPYGPSDIINHGTDGWLAENGNTGVLAEHMASLMNDAGLQQRFGTSGRTTAQKYRPEVIVEQWDSLFKSLVKERKV
ncbi:MAG: glycosyltransferase family 4 protein [Weeksellaceae bacterium]|nr:glycosyltransferase family 4 protein [Weeksellaceae bacterium]